MNNRVVAAGIAFCLLLQLHLVFVQPINWDEFRFLADVHAYERGELSAVLLTFQVHLFGWLTGLGNEIDQIRIARFVMLAIEAGTLFLIWTISRRFFDNGAALLAALGYVSFSFVLQHGASFRFDPIVTFLLMLAVALLLRERLRWLEMTATGLALALATMVSVKTALGLPLVAAAALYRVFEADDRRRALLWIAWAAATSALFLAILFYGHLGSLAAASTADSQAHLAVSYQKAIADTPFFPRLGYFLRAVTENPVHWLVLLLGVSTVAASTRASGRARTLLLLSFLLPLGSLLFYRNAYPYFYAFLLAPAAVMFAAAGSRPDLKRYLWVPVALMTAGAALHHQLALSDADTDQHRTVDAVHAIFPAPVPYLDRCSMIGSFPQAGLFLSTWWIENYRNGGRPVIASMLAERRPAFLIVNSPMLANALLGVPLKPGQWPLLPQDASTLRENFIPHWGPIWVAGKSLTAGPEPRAFEILIAGPYTLESRAPVRIDGQEVAPGATIALRRGRHAIVSAAAQQALILRWGRRLARPAGAAPAQLAFGRF